jgi:hypothetical protein
MQETRGQGRRKGRLRRTTGSSKSGTFKGSRRTRGEATTSKREGLRYGNACSANQESQSKLGVVGVVEKENQPVSKFKFVNS